jgi:hypothetical protein
MNIKEALNITREKIKLTREKFIRDIEAGKEKIETFLNAKRKVSYYN